MGLRERLSASAAEIKARSQRLVELNLELLTAELKRKGQQFGTAIGLFIAAGVLALFALGFALTTAAVALDIVLPLWLSLLIVAVALLLVVLILALVGRSALREAKSPAPQRAIDEAKATGDTLKSQVQRTVSDLTPRRNGRGGGKPPVAPPLAMPPLTPPAASGPPTAPGPSTTPGPSETPPPAAPSNQGGS